MGVIRYLQGLAEYPSLNESDVAQTHVYHAFDQSTDSAREYNLQLFNIGVSVSVTAIQFNPGDSSGLKPVISPYAISHIYSPGTYYPSYVITLSDGSSFTQPLPVLEIEARTELFLFETAGSFSFTTPTYPHTHMSIYGVAGGGGGGGGQFNTFSFSILSGGGGGGGGAAFELVRWPYGTDLRGQSVTGSVGSGGSAGSGGDGGPTPGGSGRSTIINAWGNFPRILARGGSGGQHASLTNPQGGAGGQVTEGFASLVTIPGGRGGNGARGIANTNNTPGNGASSGGTAGGGGGAHSSGNLFPANVATGASGSNSAQEITQDNPRVYGDGGDGGNARLFLRAQSGELRGAGGGGGPGAPGNTGISPRGGSGARGYVFFVFEDLSLSAPATSDEIMLFNTPGPFSFTVPVNTYSEFRLYASAPGGGGGGGAQSDYSNGKSGGGGGGSGDSLELVQAFPLSLQGQTITGTIGNPGLGGSANSNGSSGGQVTIDAVGPFDAITLRGGVGGAAGQTSTVDTVDIAGGLGGPGGNGSSSIPGIVYRNGSQGGNGASALPNGQLGATQSQGGTSNGGPGSGSGGGSASGGSGPTAFGIPGGGAGNGVVIPDKDNPNAFGAGGKGGNFGGTTNPASDGSGPGAGGGGGTGSDGTVDASGGNGGQGYVLIVLVA